ncbi:DnaD domain protein [Brevibacillus thermoruber]|uniref:DnaD domain protein n=1 Tax=Brevibacillus thermoruber TaxID=33942 RepID=UPI00068925DA|nr:DnaD domain protein [Brevibacillus thermoruber]
MNYLEQIVAFSRWKEVNPLPDSAIALWYELMAVCNKAGWPQEFTVPNAVLQSYAGLSKKEFENARQLLISIGLINYKKSQRVNQAGKYSIIYFPIVQKGKQPGTREGIHTEIQAEIQAGIQTEHSEVYGGGTLFKPKQDLNQTETDNALSAPARENFLPMINELNIKCRGLWDIDALEAFLGIMEPELIREALKRSEKKSVAYALEILRDWNAEKIHTVQALREHEGKRRSRSRGHRGNVVLMDKLPASVQWQQEQERSGAAMQPVQETRTVADDPELAEMLRNLHRSKKAGS